MRLVTEGFLSARWAAALLSCLISGSALGAACAGTIYLTLDTGNMSQAERIAAILKKQGVKATFFLANENTFRGDHALDPTWGSYWRALAGDGHAFGSHTWRHGKFLRDTKDTAVLYGVDKEPAERLDAAGVCAELNRVNAAFETLTGRKLDALWRAPGGRTTPFALKSAEQCGYRHVGWANAGFLGDELSSEKYPNDVLLNRALTRIRDGDILMMHLGIWSRQDPFAPMLDPLIAGLKQRGFCFARVTDAHK
jgi:peptidoglycan/xylan/chitin deacetylase (PgdA/CDA1 family)